MIYYHINDTPPFEGDVASLGKDYFIKGMESGREN